jgi:hypothetical protein
VVVTGESTRTRLPFPSVSSLWLTMAMPTFGIAAWSCVSRLPASAFRMPVISSDIEPVVSVTKATSTDWMFVLNFSTSFCGVGASLNGSTKKKSRFSLPRRSATIVILPPVDPPSALTVTPVVWPSGPAGSVATDVKVAPLNAPSSGRSRVNVAPAVTSRSPAGSLRITLNACVAGVGGFVDVSMKTTAFTGSSWRPFVFSPPNTGPAGPPSGDVPGGTAGFWFGSKMASRSDEPQANEAASDKTSVNETGFFMAASVAYDSRRLPWPMHDAKLPTPKLPSVGPSHLSVHRLFSRGIFVPSRRSTRSPRATHSRRTRRQASAGAVAASRGRFFGARRMGSDGRQSAGMAFGTIGTT